MKKLTKKDLQSNLFKPRGDFQIKPTKTGCRLTVYTARDMGTIFPSGFREKFAVNQLTPPFQYPCVMDISWKKDEATIDLPASFTGQKGGQIKAIAESHVVVERKTDKTWAVYFASGVCWFRVMECESEKTATWLANQLRSALVEMMFKL